MSTVAEPLTTTPVDESPPLGPRDAGMPMTLDQFDEAEYEEGWRYELINGVLIVSPPPLEEERDANEDLGYLLRRYQEDHPQGSALDLTLPEQNVRMRVQSRRPDRAIWTGLGRRPVTRGPVSKRDKPTILVEFPSRKKSDKEPDYEIKRDEYREFGVLEYWIIDRFLRSMTVWSLVEEEWTEQTFVEPAVYESPLLPGFQLDLKRLFAVSDKYLT